MTTHSDPAQKAMRGLGKKPPRSKFNLGARIHFATPTSWPDGAKKGELINGRVVGRQFNTQRQLYVYDVDDGRRWWYNVPETELVAGFKPTFVEDSKE